MGKARGWRGAPELLLELVELFEWVFVAESAIAPETARSLAERIVVETADRHGGRFIWFPHRRADPTAALSWFDVEAERDVMAQCEARLDERPDDRKAMRRRLEAATRVRIEERARSVTGREPRAESDAVETGCEAPP